jgi:hypothetical protein
MKGLIMDSPWRRSVRGNSYRFLPDGRCVSVFQQHRQGVPLYKWCISGGKGSSAEPRFSQEYFRSEEAAIYDLEMRLEVEDEGSLGSLDID